MFKTVTMLAVGSGELLSHQLHQQSHLPADNSVTVVEAPWTGAAAKQPAIAAPLRGFLDPPALTKFLYWQHHQLESGRAAAIDMPPALVQPVKVYQMKQLVQTATAGQLTHLNLHGHGLRKIEASPCLNHVSMGINYTTHCSSMACRTRRLPSAITLCNSICRLVCRSLRIPSQLVTA